MFHSEPSGLSMLQSISCGHFSNYFYRSIVFSACNGMFKEKINIMEKFVQIKSKPLNPFPKQQGVTQYKVGLHADDKLNLETQVLSTTCVSGHYCELELAELLSFSPTRKSYHNLFNKQKIITFR